MNADLVTTIQKKFIGNADELPEIRTGMQVAVHQKIIEGGKTRIQIFKGLVIKVGGKTIGEKTFTVRRTEGAIGIERVFPIASPNIEKVEIIRQYKVRRKNIRYIRKLSGKAARLKERAPKAVAA